MSKLEVIRFPMQARFEPEARERFLRAVNASATLTEIQMNEENNFSPEQLQRLRSRTERNNDLKRLVATPGRFSRGAIIVLMCKLSNCPEGRRRLVRALAGADKLAFFPKRQKQSPVGDEEAEAAHRDLPSPLELKASLDALRCLFASLDGMRHFEQVERDIRKMAKKLPSQPRDLPSPFGLEAALSTLRRQYESFANVSEDGMRHFEQLERDVRKISQ